MDNIIKKIIEIDNKALTLKKKKKEMIETNEVKLKRDLENLEKYILYEAEKVGREKYEELIEEGKKERKKILLETEVVSSGLEKTFLKMHEDLETSIFEQILKA